MTDDAPAVWTENPTDEEIHRGELVEAGIGLFIESRAKVNGRDVANRRRTYERAMQDRREREQEREHVAAWCDFHRRQAALFRQLCAEHEAKANELIGRA